MQRCTVGHTAFVLVVTTVMTAATGCSRATGPKRYRVEGTVSFVGQPVPTGTIYFEADPSRGNSGPIGLAAIEQGRYATAPGPHYRLSGTRPRR